VPRFPDLSGCALVAPSLLARLRARLPARDVVPLHIGDTFLAPPPASQLPALDLQAGPSLYAYPSPAGDQALREALAEKLRQDNGMQWVTGEHVQVTSGATHALSCALRALLAPGEELLVSAPYWPLMRGIAHAAGVGAVEVPCGPVLLERAGAATFEAILEAAITPRTAALYLSNPGNPSGCVLGPAELDALAAVARRHRLWVLADEVYEQFTYDGRRHHSIAAHPALAGCTLTAFSFSKSYGQAGLRVGYLVGPAHIMETVRCYIHHTIYSVPPVVQRAALAALRGGGEFLERARTLYCRARDLALEELCVPCAVPEGGTYLFLDLAPWVRRAGGDCAMAVLEPLASAGVLLTPGAGFGSAYGTWARLCFTAVPEPRLREGIHRINEVLARLGTP
jgi:N-succinyldiaminopimelate aminotransferase